jgi:hypothetical protein
LTSQCLRLGISNLRAKLGTLKINYLEHLPEKLPQSLA